MLIPASASWPCSFFLPSHSLTSGLASELTSGLFLLLVSSSVQIPLGDSRKRDQGLLSSPELQQAVPGLPSRVLQSGSPFRSLA